MKKLYAALLDTEHTDSIDKTQITESVIAIVKMCVKNSETVDVFKPFESYCTDNEYKNIIEKCQTEYNVIISVKIININDLVDEIISDVSSATITSTEQWDSKPFKQIIKQLDIYDKLLQELCKENISNESVGYDVLKIFMGVADLFIRCGNTLKTNFFKFYKSLKRSELRTFVEKHFTQVLAVEKNGIYTSVMNLPMGRPTGLATTFLKGVDSISTIYNIMDTKALADICVKTLTDIRRKMTRGESSYKSDLTSLANTVDKISKTLTDIVKKEEPVFSSKATEPTAPFKTLYSSMEDFRQVRKQLSDIEYRLNDAKYLNDQVDNLDTLLGDITQYLTEDTEVDQKFIHSLSTVVRYMALTFDQYGICVIRQMALEHNHVINIDQIYRSL